MLSHQASNLNSRLSEVVTDGCAGMFGLLLGAIRRRDLVFRVIQSGSYQLSAMFNHFV